MKLLVLFLAAALPFSAEAQNVGGGGANIEGALMRNICHENARNYFGFAPVA